MTKSQQGVLRVRLSPLFATCVAASLSVLVLAALAQQPAGPAPAAPSGSSVVVMEVDYIFKNHKRFNGRMADIKQEIEQFDAYVRGEQQKLNAEKEKLQVLSPSSPEYKAKEEQLVRQGSELQIKMAQKRKEFLEQEARVYYEVYKELEQTVAVFCQRNRIDLVLRFNRDEMKPDDRNSVLQGVNRAVVWQQGRDITDLILQMVNPPQPAPTTGPVVPGTQTARPPAAPTIPQRQPAPGIPR
jgi:Skp family chaperone for outer membrane proteins